MYRYVVLFAGLLLGAGCTSIQPEQAPAAQTLTDELSIKIEPAEGGQIAFWMEHQLLLREGDAPDARGRKNAFSIVVQPSVWASVTRRAAVSGYSSETECLLSGEMVKVSGMPGENFSVKIEPLVMDRFRVTGIYLASRLSDSGELGETIPFDFTAVPGEETVVYRRTVVVDPASDISPEQLLPH